MKKEGEKKRHDVKLPKKPPKEYDEIYEKRIKKVEPFGSFKRIVGETEIPELKSTQQYGIADAIKSAEHLVDEHGADPDKKVLVLTQDNKGNPAEKSITLEELSNLSKNKELFKKLKKQGGWIRFGDGGPSKPSRGDQEKTQRVLVNTAIKVAEESEAEPKRRKEFARFAARCVNTANDIGVGFGAVGGLDAIKPERPDAGLPWNARDLLGKPYIGKKDKFVADWLADNIKIRMQYAIIGDFLPNTSLGWWEKAQKKRKKKKKHGGLSELEKLLDIWHIDIEDVFDIEELAKEEEFSLDYLQEEPSTKRYAILIELMQEEGYEKEAKFLETLKIGEKEGTKF